MKNNVMQKLREAISSRQKIVKTLRILLGACVVVLSFSSFALMVFYLAYTWHDSKQNVLWMQKYKNNKDIVDASAFVRSDQKELEKMKIERGIADAPFQIAPVIVSEIENRVPASPYGAVAPARANRLQNIDYGAEVSAYQAHVNAQAQKTAKEQQAKQKSTSRKVAQKRQKQYAAQSSAPAKQQARPKLRTSTL